MCQSKMSMTCMVLWSMVLLQVTSILPTGAVSDNETTADLALQVLSVSPTAVNIQWKCTRAYNFTLTWIGQAKNPLERWRRTDTKILDLCHNASNTGKEVNTIISDLEEGMKYRLAVANKLDAISSSIQFNTLTTVPSGPPIYLRAHPVIPATMHVSWNRPKLLDCNGDILQYIIMVESGSDERNYTFNVTRKCVSITFTDIRCFSHSFSVPENELIPHEKYSVKIAAVNANGTGPFSSAIAVMSGDDEPGPPENLQVTNSNEELDEFILQWDMPGNPNGDILGYKIEYGITNDTITTSDYTDSLNYTLELSRNETYTITVYAENSVGRGRAAEIQWSASDDSDSNINNGSSSSSSSSSSSTSIKLENYTKVIICCCVGAFSLILFTCTVIVCVRSKYKKSSSSSSTSKAVPADTSYDGATTLIDLGYIHAERSNSLPYDYPHLQTNGAQALSATAFQLQRSRKSTNCNSTGTCGYIEMSALVNANPKPYPANFAIPNSSNNISKHLSVVNPSSSRSTNGAMSSPPADGAGVNAKANTNNDSGHVTSHS